MPTKCESIMVNVYRSFSLKDKIPERQSSVRANLRDSLNIDLMVDNSAGKLYLAVYVRFPLKMSNPTCLFWHSQLLIGEKSPPIMQSNALRLRQIATVRKPALNPRKPE